MTAAAKPVAVQEPVVHTGPVQDAINEAQPKGLQLVEPSAEHAVQPFTFSPAQVEIIKHTYMPGASDDELAVFLFVCTTRQLNPFTKQIYAIKRKVKRDGVKVDVYTHQTSIDGFRLIAKRTGKYRGRTTPLFCGPDGVWTEAWLSDAPPLAAKVGTLHADFDAPLYAVAKWREYVQTYDDGNPMAMWAKMPTTMLAKVAEALALRIAFPEELSGLYTDDEMAQAANAERAESRRASTTQSGEQATGTQAAAAKPADPYGALDPEDATTFTLEIAKALPLVGSPPSSKNPQGSWGGHGRKPLGEVPLEALKRAFTWFGEKLDEHRAAEDRGEKLAESKAILAPTQLHKFRVMRVAIPFVIADVEHQQGQLELNPAVEAPSATSAPGTMSKLAKAEVQKSEAGDSDFPVENEKGTSMADYLKDLREVMDHPLMPAHSREYFSHRVRNNMVNTATSAKLHIALAKLALEIGDELVTCVDDKQMKEIHGLLKQPATYKADVLTGIRDRLRAGQPGA